MGESSNSIISEPTPIGATHVRVPEEDASPTSQSKMSMEDAREIVEKLLDDPSGAQSLSDQALEAAVVLKNKDAVKYGELAIHIKESPTSANTWSGMLKAKERSLRTKKSRASGGGDRPVIVDRADLHLMVDEACQALRDLGDVYERGGELVEVVDRPGDVGINPIQRGRVRELLSMAARFERHGKEDVKPILPPTYVVDSVHARGTWDLPKLKGFVDGACMLKDGSVLSTNGFHPGSNLYVRRGADIPGLRSPTQEDAQKAYAHLTGLLVDFELSRVNRHAHESAWLSVLLTIIARPALGQDVTPFFLFDANKERVGKTRLAQMACFIASGSLPDMSASPTGRGADSEMGKTITALSRFGAPVVFFDNVKGKLGCPSLELAVTSTRWSSRILGESTNYVGDLQVTWIATSNNCQLTTDIKKRTLLIRLSTDLEDPEKRTGFKFPRIMRHIQENRAAYLKSALVILRAWHVAGRPKYGLSPWGSFEEWGDVIRNCIIHAGGADPCDTLPELDDADSGALELESVIESWPLNTPLSASQIARGMKDGYFPSDIMQGSGEFADALNEMIHKASANSVGQFLKYKKDKVVGGRRLTQGKGRDRRKWLVEEISRDT